MNNEPSPLHLSLLSPMMRCMRHQGPGMHHQHPNNKRTNDDNSDDDDDDDDDDNNNNTTTTTTAAAAKQQGMASNSAHQSRPFLASPQPTNERTKERQKIPINSNNNDNNSQCGQSKIAQARAKQRPQQWTLAPPRDFLVKQLLQGGGGVLTLVEARDVPQIVDGNRAALGQP